MNFLLYGVLALSIIGTLAGVGYKIREAGYDACKVEWSEAAEAQRKREAELSAFAAKALADERAKRKVVIQTRTVYVDRNIEKLVDSGVCVKPAGVVCINGAINGDKSADGCDADRAMPSTKPAG